MQVRAGTRIPSTHVKVGRVWWLLVNPVWEVEIENLWRKMACQTNQMVHWETLPQDIRKMQSWKTPVINLRASSTCASIYTTRTHTLLKKNVSKVVVPVYILCSEGRSSSFHVWGFQFLSAFQSSFSCSYSVCTLGFLWFRFVFLLVVLNIFSGAYPSSANFLFKSFVFLLFWFLRPNLTVRLWLALNLLYRPS